MAAVDWCCWTVSQAAEFPSATLRRPPSASKRPCLLNAPARRRCHRRQPRVLPPAGVWRAALTAGLNGGPLWPCSTADPSLSRLRNLSSACCSLSTLQTAQLGLVFMGGLRADVDDGRSSVGWKGAHATDGKNIYLMISEAQRHGRLSTAHVFLKQSRRVLANTNQNSQPVDARTMTVDAERSNTRHMLQKRLQRQGLSVRQRRPQLLQHNRHSSRARRACQRRV